MKTSFRFVPKNMHVEIKHAKKSSYRHRLAENPHQINLYRYDDFMTAMTILKKRHSHRHSDC